MLKPIFGKENDTTLIILYKVLANYGLRANLAHCLFWYSLWVMEL